MLHIIKQIKQLYIGVLFNSFAETGGNEPKFDSKKYLGERNETIRKQILEDNKAVIINYITNTLDKDHDGTILNKLFDSKDDFSGNNYMDIATFEQLLKDLNLNQYKLSEGVPIDLVVKAIEKFKLEKNDLREQSKKAIKGTMIEDGVEIPLDNLSNELSEKIHIKNNNGVFILRVEDWGADSIKLFKRYPTDSEIRHAMKAYEKGGDDEKNAGWGDEDDYDNLLNNFNEGTRISHVTRGKKLKKQETKLGKQNKEKGFIDAVSFVKPSLENNASLQNLLENTDIDNLITLDNKIKGVLSSKKGSIVNNISDFEFSDNILWDNYSDFFDSSEKTSLNVILKNAGYEIQGATGMTGNEAKSVCQAIESFSRLSENLNNNPTELAKVLMDFDYSGILGDNTNKIGDLQAFLNVDMYKDKKTIYEVIERVTGLNKNKFNSNLATNPYKTIKYFQTKLLTMLRTNSMGNIVKGNISEGLEKKYENQDNYEKSLENQGIEITDEMKKNKNFSEIYNKLENDDKQAFFNKVKLQVLGIIISNKGVFAGASFDVKEITNDILDSLEVGLFNGIPGVGVRKGAKFFDDRLDVSVGAGFTFVPFINLNVNYKVYKAEIEKYTKIYQREIETSYDFSVNGTIGIAGTVPFANLGLNMDNKNEKTKLGIEAMTQKHRKILEIMAKGAEENIDFKDLGLSKYVEADKESLPLNKDYYNQFKRDYSFINRFSDAGKQKYKDRYKNELINAYNNYYKYELYARASGINYSGITVGVAAIPGTVIPYILPKFDIISNDFDKEDNSNTLAESQTTGFDLKKLNENYKLTPQIAEHNGHKVIYLEGIDEVSAEPNSGIQVEREKNGKGIYISGIKSLSELTYNPHFKNDRQINVLKVGKGFEGTDAAGKVELKVNTDQIPSIDKDIDIKGNNSKNIDYQTGIDTNLGHDLENIKSGINPRTRYNGGAAELLDPSKDLATRWKGLERLWKIAYRNRNKKYGKGHEGVGALGKTDLGKVIEKSNSPQDQLFVITQISEFMKTAEDYKGGEISYWNSNSDKKYNKSKFIENDQKRRHSFNNLLGFNSDALAEQYYDKLEDAKKIGKTTISGLAFDATATIVDSKARRSVKGIDVNYGNIDIMTANGEIIKLPLTTNQTQGFIKKIDQIASLDSAQKDQIKQGLTNGTLKLFFFKDPNGFDDKLLLLSVDKKGDYIGTSVSNTNYRNNAESVQLYIGGAMTIDVRSHDKPTNETNNKSGNDTSTAGQDTGNVGQGQDGTNITNPNTQQQFNGNVPQTPSGENYTPQTSQTNPGRGHTIN